MEFHSLRNRWWQTMLAALLIAIACVHAQDFQFETYPTDEVSVCNLFQFAISYYLHIHFILFLASILACKLFTLLFETFIQTNICTKFCLNDISFYEKKNVFFSSFKQILFAERGEAEESLPTNVATYEQV